MRRPILILLLLLTASLAGAQDPKRDFADGQFFLAAEEYEEALFTFTKVYNSGYQDNANVNYLIGVCLLQIPGRKTEAIPYLEKAVTSVSEKYNEESFREENAPEDAHLYLGNAYRIDMRFEEACEQYRLFDEYVGTDGDIRSLYAGQQITSCSNAVVAINNPVDAGTGNLGQLARTHQETYNHVVSADMNTMAYMGQNPFYKGIYVSRKEGGTWGRPLGINPSIVSEGNMEVVGLSPDGNTMLLVVADQFASNIYMAKWENERWNPAESLGKPINSRYYESHATFTPDMKSIYFTSNRRPEKAMDIFRSDLQEDGTWGDPVQLGGNINTPLNEETPVLSPDGKRLYFSSQGHNSIGGFDVFYSDLQDDGSWGKAINAGYPLNTTDDDFTLNPTGFKDEAFAYLFANAGGEQVPLFKFELIEPSATPVPVPFLEGGEEVLAEETTEAEEETVEAVEETPEEAPEVIPVTPPAPEKYMVNPVFFGFDSDALTAEAKKELDKIADLMQRFPDLAIEVTGHTDAVGTFDYNQGLSMRRANSAAAYLAGKGLDSKRVSVKGKSESEPVALNRKNNRDLPEGRKLNRRVQFTVTTTAEVIVEMEPVHVPEHLRITD